MAQNVHCEKHAAGHINAPDELHHLVYCSGCSAAARGALCCQADSRPEQLWLNERVLERLTYATLVDAAQVKLTPTVI